MCIKRNYPRSRNIPRRRGSVRLELNFRPDSFCSRSCLQSRRDLGEGRKKIRTIHHSYYEARQGTGKAAARGVECKKLLSGVATDMNAFTTPWRSSVYHNLVTNNVHFFPLHVSALFQGLFSSERINSEGAENCS